MKDSMQAWREVIAPEAAGEGARDDAPRSPGAGEWPEARRKLYKLLHVLQLLMRFCGLLPAECTLHTARTPGFTESASPQGRAGCVGSRAPSPKEGGQDDCSRNFQELDLARDHMNAFDDLKYHHITIIEKVNYGFH